MAGRRRGRGEGSIARRADGRWVARLDLGWHEGRRIRKYFYGNTRAEAWDKYTKARRDLQDGVSFTNHRQTLGQFLTSWLTDIARLRVRPRTYDTYEPAVRRHIVPYLGKHQLTKLTPQHVQGWLSAP